MHGIDFFISARSIQNSEFAKNACGNCVFWYGLHLSSLLLFTHPDTNILKFYSHPYLLLPPGALILNKLDLIDLTTKWNPGNLFVPTTDIKKSKQSAFPYPTSKVSLLISIKEQPFWINWPVSIPLSMTIKFKFLFSVKIISLHLGLWDGNYA
jgi:hypothetical protein